MSGCGDEPASPPPAACVEAIEAADEGRALWVIANGYTTDTLGFMADGDYAAANESTQRINDLEPDVRANTERYSEASSACLGES